MPPQRYSMSGPFLALAAAAKFGMRLSVDCSTVLIVMFGCRAWYFATDVARNLSRPWASWLPHHHIVSVIGPPAAALEPPPELPPSPPPHAAAVARATATAPTARCRPRPRTRVLSMTPPR